MLCLGRGQGLGQAGILSGGYREESTPSLSQGIGRILFLAALEARSLFPLLAIGQGFQRLPAFFPVWPFCRRAGNEALNLPFATDVSCHQSEKAVRFEGPV